MNSNIKFRRLGVMIDNSRNAVMKVETVKEYIDIISKLGYNCLSLYTEDTYEIKSQPYFGHNRGRYSQNELKIIDEYATQKGIEIIPCIQTLAHLNTIMRWDCYSEICDCGDILLAEDEKTYSFIEDMFATLSQTFTSRTVNIGMDEANMVGRGKYYNIHGDKNKLEILINHLRRVAEIAAKYNFEIIMWGDMFMHLLKESKTKSDEAAIVGSGDLKEIKIPQSLKDSIPKNVNLIYWDYYSKDQTHYDKNISVYSAIKENLWFAGGIWTWTGFIPHNRYSMETSKVALTSCMENGVNDVFLTIWGDGGAETSKFSILPSLYYISQIAKGVDDIDSIKSGFLKEFGISFDDYMLIDLPLTPTASERRLVNAEKYLFYNDCFMGLFDTKVSENDGKCYHIAAQNLKKIPSTYKYKYIFESAEKLCEVLSLKCDIGLRTRKAYESKNKNELTKLIKDYDNLIGLIKEFYSAFERQWMIENKPHGFDVQDIRIGGLIQRILHCKNRLTEYVNGNLSIIEELEEPLLDESCNGTNKGEHKWWFKNWNTIVTTNNL